MKERIKMLHIDYVVTFIKTRRHGNIGQTDEHDDSEMEEIAPARKKQCNNVFPH